MFSVVFFQQIASGNGTHYSTHYFIFASTFRKKFLSLARPSQYLLRMLVFFVAALGLDHTLLMRVFPITLTE